MNTSAAFFWSASGFVLAVVVEEYLRYNDMHRLRARVYSPVMWALTGVVACGAGAFAVATGVSTEIQAMFTGIAFPFIIQRFVSDQRNRSDQTSGTLPKSNPGAEH